MASTAEIMVIDAPRGASWALDAYRPRHEHAHLLCRSSGEQASVFASRVVKRIGFIRRGAEVLGLTLVLGQDPNFNHLMPDLSQQLASSVAPSGFITLVGVGACQPNVIAWFESLKILAEPSVTFGAWFLPL